MAQRLLIFSHDDSTSDAVARVEQCKLPFEEAQVVVHTDDLGWNTDVPFETGNSDGKDHGLSAFYL
jgi:hypothetical protein